MWSHRSFSVHSFLAGAMEVIGVVDSTLTDPHVAPITLTILTGDCTDVTALAVLHACTRGWHGI